MLCEDGDLYDSLCVAIPGKPQISLASPFLESESVIRYCL